MVRAGLSDEGFGMRLLFSKNGLNTLESLAFTKTLFAFDYDGTLAKIVKRPEDADLPTTTQDLLNQLERLAPLAIISGRSVKDLKLRVKAPILIGNHGLEGSTLKSGELKKAALATSHYLKTFDESSLPSGIDMENKTYSLAVHYRRTRNKKTAREKLMSVAENLLPAPRIIPGKSVLNILPPGAPHKGTALLALMDQLKVKRAFYIGDDDTDEDVFSLLDDRILSVRVGQKRRSHARFYLKRQSEINTLLKKLIHYHQGDQGPSCSKSDGVSGERQRPVRIVLCAAARG
ncbi:MAG: trehalose-phosphatase, partial [Proteobacteria bacterium]